LRQGCCVWDKAGTVWDKLFGDKSPVIGTRLPCFGQGYCVLDKAAVFGISLLVLGQGGVWYCLGRIVWIQVFCDYRTRLLYLGKAAVFQTRLHCLRQGCLIWYCSGQSVKIQVSCIYRTRLLYLGQGRCVWDKAAVFGTRLLYLVQGYYCLWQASLLCLDKAAVFGTRVLCFGTRLLCAVMLGTRLLCLGQCCCVWDKADVIGKRLLHLG